ncbi:hypothetical protein Xedl_01510 [Xenorhabdus eapokensis]|uniref:Uncharacterized protein n=1 Tax=Xenorhabdus eapokensis TaxID=1873482 RepID=A0A1Q5TUS9_9GAMM|nr:hypothetical protein Xedl_01510 [Xenorhabdus eapokensis]
MPHKAQNDAEVRCLPSNLMILAFGPYQTQGDTWSEAPPTCSSNNMKVPHGRDGKKVTVPPSLLLVIPAYRVYVCTRIAANCLLFQLSTISTIILTIFDKKIKVTVASISLQVMR